MCIFRPELALPKRGNELPYNITFICVFESTLPFLVRTHELWKEFSRWQQKNPDQSRSPLCSLLGAEIKFSAMRFRNRVHRGGCRCLLSGTAEAEAGEGSTAAMRWQLLDAPLQACPDGLCSCWMGSGFRGCELQEQVGLPAAGPDMGQSRKRDLSSFQSGKGSDKEALCELA